MKKHGRKTTDSIELSNIVLNKFVLSFLKFIKIEKIDLIVYKV